MKMLLVMAGWSFLLSALPVGGQDAGPAGKSSAVPSGVSSGEASAESSGEAWRRLRSAEEAQMRGDDRTAFSLYAETLESVAELGGERRAKVLFLAELAMRRLYAIAGSTGHYADLARILEPWSAHEAPDAPAAAEPALAELARFFRGAAIAYSNPDVERARAVWAPLGFLEKWRVVGPFDNERGGGFDVASEPERAAVPDLEASYPGKVRAVSWRELPVKPLAGSVDLDALFRPNDQALAYV